MTPDLTKAARELLAFYLEAGADALLAEEPVDRFADREPIAAATRPPLSTPAAKVRPDAGRAPPPPLAAPLAPDAAASDARALARNRSEEHTSELQSPVH